MSLASCNEAKGIDKSIANLLGLLNEYKSQRDGMCEELGLLCDFQLYDNEITSLIHGHDDVTVENATERTCIRKGFYSEDI